MQHSAEMFRCIDEADVHGAWMLWSSVSPHLPQPKTYDEAAATLHYARTHLNSIRIAKRAYSHAWLTDRGLPSALPDWLRPIAERFYPRIVEGVGIAVAAPRSRRSLAMAMRTAMEQVVLECYAEKQTDPAFVKARMTEAKLKVLKGD